MNSTLEKRIDDFIKENRDDIVRDIGALVAIPSVAGEPAEGAPFGKASRQALDKGLEIAARLGLDTRNCGNMIGWAELAGEEKDKYIATITHLDVVPAGTGWTGDPFDMRQRDGYIIGRGVMDDKGPSVLCLYALKFFKECGVMLHYTVRALLGTAEETGMEDVKYYLANYPAPAFLFSPDADFPVCNGEKGIYQARITATAPTENIVSFTGGIVVNAVPDTAEALMRADASKLRDTERVHVEAKDGLAHITARGVAGHASRPEGTVNAIGVLAGYILENGLAGAEEAKFLRLMMKLHSASDGSGLGVKSADDKFGPLTIIGGMAGMTDGRLWQTADSRYPTTMTGEELTRAILAAADGCAEVKVLSDNKPFYIDAGSPAIQACIGAYNEVTGEGKKPFTIGGGTYARDFPFGVSFGPEHDDRPFPAFAGGIHSVDEGANVNYFLEALKIYILAIIRLQDVRL